MRALDTESLRSRADAVELVLTDSDGVLTDTGVYYTDAGEAMKRFSIRDGMGVERLRAAGIETGILTGETSGSVARRGEKLGLRVVRLGVEDKARELDSILEETGLELSRVAYIGDDVNDASTLLRVGEVGLTAAPADALPAVAEIVHYRCRVGGGHGAFRDFADWILINRTRGSR